MDDMINRHNSIAEENVAPHGRPAKNRFGEWSEAISEHTGTEPKETKEKSEEEKKKLIQEMEEIIKKELE